jgi:copper oxidase (laccase) domain-containing protein
MSNALVEKFEKNQQAIAKLNREIEKAVGAQVAKKAELEKQNEDMRQAILEAMEANGVTKFDGDLITITYVAPTTRTGFDSTRFKEERPKTWAKYLKTTNVKASIRLKVKA